MGQSQHFNQSQLQYKAQQLSSGQPIHKSPLLEKGLLRWVAVAGVAVVAICQVAIAQERMAGSCPLLVSPINSEFQPKRIAPAQVTAKNAGGCLSPSDAVYGPDGCPLKLCGANAGVIQLPVP